MTKRHYEQPEMTPSFSLYPFLLSVTVLTFRQRGTRSNKDSSKEQREETSISKASVNRIPSSSHSVICCLTLRPPRIGETEEIDNGMTNKRGMREEVMGLSRYRSEDDVDESVGRNGGRGGKVKGRGKGEEVWG